MLRSLSVINCRPFAGKVSRNMGCNVGASASVQDVQMARLSHFRAYEQVIVCKRFSSNSINQQERAGLSHSRRKCFENKGFSGSAGNKRPI
jgi:hypothetical protein